MRGVGVYGVRNNIPVIMILKICNPDPDMYIIIAFIGILSSTHQILYTQEFRNYGHQNRPTLKGPIIGNTRECKGNAKEGKGEGKGRDDGTFLQEQ